MTIGERIRYLRTQKGLLQEDLAKATNSKKQAICKYENGIVTNIPLDKIEIMAKVLDVSPAYLMGWEEENSSEETQNISQPITPHEQAVLEAYRSQPEMQPAVDRLLGVPAEPKISAAPAEEDIISAVLRHKTSTGTK